MSAVQPDREPARFARPRGNLRQRPYRDASGDSVFCAGQAGAAHVMAHRMLDEGRLVQGHRLLEDWLDGRTGSGSEWVHLQWHMALFELALGHWRSAFARFMKHILPAARETENALTDAPALLWRLSLAAPARVDLPWKPVRARALIRMRRPRGSFIELHNLLALAGAGDVESLDRWSRERAAGGRSRSEDLLARMAVGLSAYAVGNYQAAATVLAGVVPHVSEIGGSRAQGELFESIGRSSERMAALDRSTRPLAQVA